MQGLEELDIKELILKVREASGADSDAAFSELIQRYMPMIKKVTSGFFGASFSADEMFCEASVAFYKATLSYNLERTDVTFGLYAKICVYRRLCDLVGKENGKEKLFSDLDVENIAVHSGIEAALVSRERMAAALSKARSMLSEYEYEVFILHLEGYGTAAIAERLGRDSKSVDNAKARIFKRLRDGSSGFSDIQ